MKRLTLETEDRMFLKAIEGDPAMVLLLMFRIYPVPVNADQLTFEFKWDARGNRAKKVLADLSSDGFTALMKGQGYVLTSPAVRRISDFFAPILLKQLGGMEALAHGMQVQALSPVSTAGTETVEADLVVIEAVKDESQLKISTQNAGALKKEEDAKFIKNQESTSSDSGAQNVCTSEAVEIAPGVTTARVLECSSMLEGFGEGVFLRGLQIDVIHPRLALGWLAQGYTQRETLARPAGLVYSRLKDLEAPKPQSKFFEGWESFLPDDYLMAIGWLKAECAACHAEFSTLEELRAHESFMMVCEIGCGVRVHTAEELAAHHQSHEPHLTIFAALPSDDRGAKAWELVKGTLQKEMPKPSFETWVRDTKAVEFEDGKLKVAVRNAYARDWLESRLAAKVNAMLKMYLQEAVMVAFVVGKIAEEESE